VSAGNQHRILYHYVDMDRVDAVLQSGLLSPVALPGRGRRLRRLPGVVWLTEVPDAKAMPVTALSPTVTSEEASLARFTVSVADAQHWRHWAARHKPPRATRADLERDGWSDLWWVVTRPIPFPEWLLVRKVSDGEVLWRSESVPRSPVTPA
jgi:hypothetical protein